MVILGRSHKVSNMKRFNVGDEVMLDAAVYSGDRLKCRAIVCESFHPSASGYHLKTLEDSVYRKGHRIWVSSSEVEAIGHE